EGSPHHLALYLRVQAFLAKPGESWKQAYINAPLGERLLCLEVMASGGLIPFEELKERYTEACAAYQPVAAFDQALVGAEVTFLRRRIMWDQQVFVTFHHPTMRDLLIELLRSDRAIRRTYISRLSLSELTSAVFPGAYQAYLESSSHRVHFD